MAEAFDFLVIGGGSAGCVVARRLADAGVGSVLLLEAGRSDEHEPALLDLSRLDQQDETTEWGFEAGPIRGSDYRIAYARARVLGGCGNHNDCAFLQPPPFDLDQWAARGANGWSYQEMRPFLNRVSDRVRVEDRPPINAISMAFIQAGQAMGLPVRAFRDAIAEGVGPFPLNVAGVARQAASQAYLHPLDSLPSSLTVRCNARVEKLLVDGDTAIGCVANGTEIIASKEVIVCAGAIQTPQLLMLSGIGPERDLASLGIPVKANLPGVGRNLMDHAAANICFEMHDSMPPWALTPCEVTMMLNGDDGSGCPELLYHFVLRLREKGIAGSTQFGNLNGVKISPNVTRPLSRGCLQIVSPSIADQPVIELNYFSDPAGYDMDTMIYGLRRAREIATLEPLSDLLGNEIFPGPDVQADGALEQYVRETCETVYHPAGTCKIGDVEDPLAVVTPSLKVRGISNLRIADASVFPTMITVNINNSVMMVAEKGADLVLLDALQR